MSLLEPPLAQARGDIEDATGLGRFGFALTNTVS